MRSGEGSEAISRWPSSALLLLLLPAAAAPTGDLLRPALAFPAEGVRNLDTVRPALRHVPPLMAPNDEGTLP